MPIVYLQAPEMTARRPRRNPVTAAIEDFADQHNLRLRTHDDGSRICSLCFEHPLGGHVRIEVTAGADDAVRLVSLWWQDDYDSFSRNTRRHVATGTRATTGALERLLDNALSLILSWQPGEWTESDSGYEAQWSWFTRREFQHAMSARAWPRPKLSH